MHRWLKDGVEPPKMPLIEVSEGAVVRDEHGNAKGGIRLPEFAVATATHSGTGKAVQGGNRFAFYYGFAQDFSDEQLARLYPTREAFLTAYDEALKQCVEEGTVLAEDAPKLRETSIAWSSRLK